MKGENESLPTSSGACVGCRFHDSGALTVAMLVNHGLPYMQSATAYGLFSKKSIDCRKMP